MNDSHSSHRTFFRFLGGLFLIGTLVWIAFFDSHSLVKRYRWHQELDALKTENDSLRRDIRNLQRRLDRPLSDSAVQHIAREQYGMKRPDEDVYRVEKQ